MSQQYSTPTLEINEIYKIIESSLLGIKKYKKVLLIHPDYSRNDFSHLISPILYEILKTKGLRSLDTLNAGGTHRKMSMHEIEKKLGLSKANHPLINQMLNHEFDNKEQLLHATTIDKKFISEKTSGNLCENLDVDVNKIITEDYDLIVAINGTVPHEALGYSGGTKIFFPGISGPNVIGMLHWAAVLMGVPQIIGTVDNPARDVVNYGTREIFNLIPNTKILSLNMVYTEDEDHNALPKALYTGLGYDGFINAHKEASLLSSKLHIKYINKPKKKVVQQLPLMYDEIWTAGKGSYKLQKQGVLADDAEIILLAPHIDCFHSNESLDKEIRQIGYHGLEYVLDFCKMNPTFNRNVASHVINVRSFGKMFNGVEKFPFRLTLATQIDEKTCQSVNLGYADYRTLNKSDFESEDTLWIEDGGQWLYDVSR